MMCFLFAARGSGEPCIECPNDGSVCLGGVTETQAATGFWLYQARTSGAGVGEGGDSGIAASVSFVQCEPVDACIQGNTCAFGYEGELVR